MAGLLTGAPTGVARDLDRRPDELRLFLRFAVPVALVFAIGEGALALAYRSGLALAGTLSITAWAIWVQLYLRPRIGRVPISTTAIQLSLAMFPAVILAGLPEPGGGTIAALLPLAVGLAYIEGPALRRLTILSLAVGVLVALTADALPVDPGIPAEVRMILNATGVTAAFGLVAFLIGQFAARLRSTTSELMSLAALSNDLAQTLDPFEVGDLTARHLAEAMGADEGAICYWDPATDRVLTYGYHPTERRSAVAESYALSDFPATRRVLVEQVPVVIRDTDPSADRAEVGYLHSIGQRSSAMIPLVANGRSLGAIELTSSDPDRFDARGLAIGGTLAAEAAMALENARLYAELHHQAFHDALTGLANRDLFRDRVEHALTRRPGRAAGRVAVMFLDLDDFKTVNDSLGHAGGDQLLGAVAARVAGVLRPNDTAARLGGDEFAILLEDLRSEDEAGLVAQRLIDALRAPVRVGETAALVATSIGIAVSEPGGETVDQLLRNADFAMYRAKKLGKGRYEIFRASLREEVDERLILESLLKGAIGRDELRIQYQPIVELADGATVGVEALLRWEVPGRGLLMPADFIALAEESGLIVEVGRWVLEGACRQVRAWQDELDVPHLTVSVNLSARQFQHPDLVAEVGGALAASGLAPACLVLEITESVLMATTASTIGKLADLRRMGVRLAIDDFGTGYSSLGYLERFPVDILKIDKTFVDGIGERGSRPVLARAILQLGRALDLAVVAEGIERDEQVTVLRRLGCARGQGYLFARPLPPEDLGTRLRRERGVISSDAEDPGRVPIRLADARSGVAAPSPDRRPGMAAG
jgi:diguanylate cyclase (GGDEF)-like protein